MPDVGSQRNRRALLAGSLVIWGGLLVAGEVLSSMVLPEGRWSNAPLHSAMEAFGAVITAALAAFLLLTREETSQPWRLWLACSTLGIGILTGFHACLPPGSEFVWLHSLGFLVGGLFVAMAWLPEPVAHTRGARLLPWLVGIGTASVGTLLLLWGNLLPAMIQAGEFTAIARLVHFAGGLGFLAGAAYFALQYLRNQHTSCLVFTV